MSNENYINHYVEILTNTMTDAVIRNISLQANSKVSEDVIKALESRIEELNNAVNRYQQGQSDEVVSLKSSIENHLNTITRLNSEISQLNTMRGEYENTKNQVQHIDTFRNALAKERDDHKKVCQEYDKRILELNDRIEYLQLTPAKRKKIDDEKAKQVETPSVLPITQETLKDGGEF